jgi:hypothetical protein
MQNVPGTFCMNVPFHGIVSIRKLPLPSREGAGVRGIEE